MPGLGINSFIQLKTQSVSGTLETSSTFKRLAGVTGLSLVPDTSFLESNAITPNAAQAYLYPGAINWRGPINMEASYASMDQLIYGLMGDFTDSTPTGHGGVAFDHWFEVDASPPNYSMEVCYGNIPATDKVFAWVDTYVESIEFNCSAPGLMTFSAGLVPWKEVSTAGTGNSAQTADVTYTHYPVSYAHGTAVDLGNADSGNDYCVRNFRLRAQRPFDNSRACIGSTTAKVPLVNGLVTVEGEVEIEFDDKDIYDDFLAQTLMDEDTTAGDGLNIVFTSDVAIAGTATPTLYYQLEFMVPYYYYIGPSTPTIDGAGIITQRIGFRSFGTGGTGATGTPPDVSTKHPLAIRTRNDTASAGW